MHVFASSTCTCDGRTAPSGCKKKEGRRRPRADHFPACIKVCRTCSKASPDGCTGWSTILVSGGFTGCSTGCSRSVTGAVGVMRKVQLPVICTSSATHCFVVASKCVPLPHTGAQVLVATSQNMESGQTIFVALLGANGPAPGSALGTLLLVRLWSSNLADSQAGGVSSFWLNPARACRKAA